MTALGGHRLHADHLSAAELAALQLPGLPTSDRRLREFAESQGWPAGDRIGRGGGRVYPIAALPAAALAELQRRRAIALARADGTRRAPETIRRGRGRPAGTDFFTRNPDVADAVESLVARQPLAAPRILELLETRFGAQQLPHLRTLRRYMAFLETSKPALLASVRDPDLYKSQYRVALGRADGSIDRAHQRWEIDTTPADVLTSDGIRSILGIIDVFSRRVRFLVVPSESGQSVRRMLISTIAAWGVVPEVLGTDNGSGFINRSIVSALEILGIAHDPCLPGSPERKPFIERIFGTFTRERAELLPGYKGHSVADAQKLRAAAKKRTGRAVITAGLHSDELQRILDNWTDGVYLYRKHGTLGVSPHEREQASPVPARRAPDAELLTLALSRAEGVYTVGKRGVQWKGGRYWSPALVGYVGRQVQVRRDEDDLGALILFDADGHFIDVAVDHARAGLSEAEFAAAAKAQQESHMAEARAGLRVKQRAFSFEAARDALLRRDAEAAGKLATLPLRTAVHSTPALDSLADRPEPQADMAAIDRAIAHLVTPKAAPAERSVADKIAEADALIRAADCGEAVDAERLRWARHYARSSEYRVEKLFEADFRPTRSAPESTVKGQVA